MLLTRKVIFVLMYMPFAVFATAPTISITFLSTPQTIQQILKLQQKMPMSKQPKELSAQPNVICFNANIAQFLPADIQAQPTYGCVFSDQVSMNAAMLRAGLFVHTAMGMATDNQLFNSKLMSTVGGHDFSAQQLLAYYKQIHIPEQTLPEHATFKAIEQEFNQQIMQPILQQNKGNFIFFTVINTKKFKENLSHELLHAQYYNVPQIASILDEVWKTVPKKDQDLIIDCLRNGGYDMNQHDLLLREFYSYFLQYNAEKYLLTIPVLKPMAPLATKYAKQIRAALARHGIKILTV